MLLLDRCRPQELGGLAREAFGGMFMVDSPEQRRSRIPDNERLALEDWLRIAELRARGRVAEALGRAVRDARARRRGGWLREIGVRFFPVVNWAERGNFGDGNSVPRFHLTWGTGKALVQAVWGAIESHPRRSSSGCALRRARDELLIEDGQVVGCRVATCEGRGMSRRADREGTQMASAERVPTSGPTHERTPASYEVRAATRRGDRRRGASAATWRSCAANGRPTDSGARRRRC